MSKSGQPCPTCGKGWNSDMDGDCAWCAGPARLASSKPYLPPPVSLVGALQDTVPIRKPDGRTAHPANQEVWELQLASMTAAFESVMGKAGAKIAELEAENKLFRDAILNADDGGLCPWCSTNGDRHGESCVFLVAKGGQAVPL